jgi:hypothetical protein
VMSVYQMLLFHQVERVRAVSECAATLASKGATVNFILEPHRDFSVDVIIFCIYFEFRRPLPLSLKALPMSSWLWT